MTHFRTSLKCSPQMRQGYTDGKRPICHGEQNSTGEGVNQMQVYHELQKKERGVAVPCACSETFPSDAAFVAAVRGLHNRITMRARDKLKRRWDGLRLPYECSDVPLELPRRLLGVLNSNSTITHSTMTRREEEG